MAPSIRVRLGIDHDPPLHGPIRVIIHEDPHAKPQRPGGTGKVKERWRYAGRVVLTERPASGSPPPYPDRSNRRDSESDHEYYSQM
jgi:hypothetical protein